ncbi:PREDICTED: short-chain dehydrogenase/reductase 3 [Galeopterus variegatus]|uniref:Short-chain dehydrogenase/reductase 3 n=1 Tax=Galeopterus variegatus TaxID=482537 RepID=A0ABM0RKT1_GALVR|nr:PREDICTED: short-chain dehydrogenase/reductase 3 [Galeopterus variegatus]
MPSDSCKSHTTNQFQSKVLETPARLLSISEGSSGTKHCQSILSVCAAGVTSGRRRGGACVARRLRPGGCWHLASHLQLRVQPQIVLWGRTEKCLKETTEEIRQMGTECHYFICDVGNREEVYQTAKAVREKVGDITILVNNAAVVHGKSLMDSDDDALLKSQHINTLGQFWTTKAFLPRMLELQNGHIVCLNSVLALSAIPGAIDYCTSKASAFAFMESLTLGLLDCPGVSATTVLPFHTSTEMFQGMRVRFPNLFPPLKPETVARRTVEAVQLNQALLLLPWTMHALIILKSILPQAALEEIHRFSGTYTCMNTFKGRT